MDRRQNVVGFPRLYRPESLQARVLGLLMAAGEADTADLAWCYRALAEPLLIGPRADGEDAQITAARDEAERHRAFALCLIP